MGHPAVSFAIACIGAGVLLAGPAAAAEPPEVSALIQRARLWVARDRPDLARDALERLARLAPGHPGALAVKAELELRSGAADAARATLEQLRQADPKHPEIERIETLLRLDGPDKAKLREARLLAKSGHTAQAIAALRSLYPKGPPAGELALEYWQLIGSAGAGWAEAHAGLAALARQDPDNPRNRFALAEHELGRAPLNAQALRQVIESARLPAFTRQARAAWRRAMLRLDAEPNAVNLLEEYLVVEPADTAAREKLAAVRAGVQERKRLAADPAYQAGQQGLALLERGDLVGAEPLLERAIAGRPNDADTAGGLGLLRLRQGRHAEAQPWFARARQLGPGNASKWRSLEQTARTWSAIQASGDALDQGDAVAAERNAREALRLVPNHPDATLALARAQARQGLPGPAEQSYRAVLAAEPVNTAAFRGLLALVAERRGPQAVDALFAGLSAPQRKAFAEDIDAARVATLRSDADRLAAAGRTDDARRALESALRLAPDDAWLRYRLARLHADRGAPQQGRAVLDELLQRLPTDSAALHANALFLARLDDDEAALATLARVAAAQRSDAMRRLEQRLEVQRRSKRARVLAQRGERTEATALLAEAQALVAADVDAALSVARGWIDLGDTARAGALLDRAEAGAGSDSAADLAALRSTLLQANARRLIADQQPAQAADLLERALALTPDDAWLRYDIAQLAARQGDAARGLALLVSGVDRAPADPQAVHALALYQSQRNDAVAALRTLERLPPQARSGAPLRTQRRLWLQAQVQRAEAAASAGDAPAARALLTQAEAAIAGDAALATTLAAAWIELGETDQARRMLADAGESAAPAARLRRAALFTQLGDVDRVGGLLDDVARAPALSSEEFETIQELRDSLAIRRAEQRARDGQVNGALELLQARADAAPRRARVVFAQAEVLRDAQRYPEALERYRQVLLLDPAFDAAHWNLADSLVRNGDAARAREAVERLLSAHPGDARALRLLATLEQQQGNHAAALQALRAAAQADWSARMAAAPAGGLSRLEGADSDRNAPAGPAALVAVLAAPPGAGAEAGRWWPYRSLAPELDLNNRWVSGGLDWRFRSGSEGKSTFDLKELPVERRWPWQRGQGVLRADVVRLDAGTLNLADTTNARDFGQVLLCQPGCASGGFAQTATGLALNVGYETETLRLDLGSTPLGFPLRRVVGGLRVKGDLGPLSVSLDVSSRPVTSSLLSYAGARDPRSGRHWGGVQASGASLTLSADRGGAFGGWALLAGHRLTGTEVQSNDRRQLMGGAYWRIVNRENRQFSVGVTAVKQAFSHNAGEYSFGHGGYYSPSSHRSVSLPLTFSERGARFSYLLRAAVSDSNSRTDRAPFYPTDAALQASAVALTPTNGVTPVYAGGPGGGRGHSLAAALEYQWAPNLQLGVRLEIERSRDYEPNRALFYLRWALDGATALPLAMPPKAVLPTSEL